MVGSISSNAIVNSQAAVKKESAEKLYKYVSGQTIEQAPDTFKSNLKSSAGSAAVFEGLPVLFFLGRNVKSKGAASKAMKALDGANKSAFENLLKGKDKLTQRLGDFIDTANNSKRMYADIKSDVKTIRKSQKAASKAQKLTAKANAKNSSKLAAKAEKLTAKSQKLAEGAKSASSRIAETQVKAQTAKAAGKLGKFGKFMKSSGAGVMLVFSGLIEGLTEVVPTFKELGKEKGIKQLGKSAVKVAGDTFGFIAGEQIGTALGAAAGSALAGTKIGAAIGSVVPGFGTILGAVAGCALGMVGSWAMGKVTKSVTGKSEREIAQEQQNQQQAQNIVNDTELIEQLKEAAIAKIEEEQATTGKLSEDSIAAYQAIQNLETKNPFAA